MLNKMFEKQKILQERLNGNLKDKVINNQEFINIMSLALIDEIMEALRETKYKPWKTKMEFNNENFKEELIDAWHFLINLSIASGMNADELFNRFINKNKENHRRQDNGY